MVQGGETVSARLGGRGVALRPLRTWNGEGASGEEVRQGPEGEPLSRALGGQCWALEAASYRLAREGIWWEVQTAVTWKTKQMGRRGRLPSREKGAAGDTAPGPTWPGVVWP